MQRELFSRIWEKLPFLARREKGLSRLQGKALKHKKKAAGVFLPALLRRGAGAAGEFQKRAGAGGAALRQGRRAAFAEEVKAKREKRVFSGKRAKNVI